VNFSSIGGALLARDAFHRVERLLEPVAEVALACDGIEDPSPRRERLHPETGVDERPRPGRCQRQVDERPGVGATDAQLAQLLEPIDDHVQLLIAERGLRHLPIGAALLEAFALDLNDFRPPVGVPIYIADEPPDDIDRGIDEGLSAAVGHGSGVHRRIAEIETLVTPYFWVALSARSETKRYSVFSRQVSISNPAPSIAAR